MFGWIKSNLWLSIAIVALGVVIAAEGRYIVKQSATIGGLKESSKTVNNKLTEKDLELVTLRAAHKTLTAAHDKCLSEVTVAQGEQAVSAQQVATLVERIEANGAAVRSIRDQIYLEPSCEALSKMDIARMCPGIANSLRQRASQSARPD